MIAIGLVFWYRSKANQTSNQDQINDVQPPTQEAQVQVDSTAVISRNQQDLNAAWEQASQNSQDQSVYDNAPLQATPFMSLNRSCSSFRPLDKPPICAESIPMTVHKSTMTNSATLEALSTLERNAKQSKGARPRKFQSNPSLENARRTQIRNATYSHLAQAGHYIVPTRERPPTPTRTSSLRKVKARKAKQSYTDSVVDSSS